MARELNLPSWALATAPGVIVIQAADMYPDMLDELGVAKGAIDGYWLKVARYCAMRDVQLAVAGTDHMPPAGGALQIRIKDADKDEHGSPWRLSAHPEGKSTNKAAMQAEYQRIRRGLV